MKRSALFITALLMAWQVCAKDVYVALSPDEYTSVKQPQVKTVLEFLTRLDAGDTAYILNGLSLQTIGRFDIPENPKYNSPKIRLKLNGKTVAAMMAFAKATNPYPEGGHQAVSMPELLRQIAQGRANTEPYDVIVLGQPYYTSTRNRIWDNNFIFSRYNDLLPSDGHLQHTTLDTPFGIDDKNLFAGMRLHIGFPGEQTFLTSRQRSHIKRFWSLFASEQSGQMVSFTADLPALFERVITQAPAPRETYTLENSDKLDMIRLRRNKPDQTIYERPLSEAALPVEVMKAAMNVEIGLTWDCGTCDLDLYASPFTGAKTLYYGQNATDEGFHLKDFTSSPRAENGYETIQFIKPVNLHNLRIVVNFYGGDAPQGVKGTLRIAAGGKTYAHPFTFAAGQGNKGADVQETLNGAPRSEGLSLLIDPVKVVSMN